MDFAYGILSRLTFYINGISLSRDIALARIFRGAHGRFFEQNRRGSALRRRTVA